MRITYSFYFFFFFQAEDGIRDKLVTGVQTCALPILPPYVEYVKWRENFAAPRGKDLVEASLGILGQHLQRIPRMNPFPRFKERFARDLEWLMAAPITDFHKYSFATLRQYGACFELGGTYLSWLGAQGVDGLDETVAALESISHTAKAFQFQLARSMAR